MFHVKQFSGRRASIFRTPAISLSGGISDNSPAFTAGSGAEPNGSPIGTMKRATRCHAALNRCLRDSGSSAAIFPSSELLGYFRPSPTGRVTSTFES